MKIRFFSNPVKAFIFLLCILIALSSFQIAAFAAASPITRTDDPVVIKGSDISSLNGILPSELVAFRYTGSAWEQIPVQVDEKKVVSYGKSVYNSKRGGYVTEAYDRFENTVYCDTSTHVGADADTSVDSDDEIVFMSCDIGSKAPDPFTYPDNVKNTRCAEIKLTDPLVSGSEGYVYLFIRSSNAISGSAGKSYVSYNFSLKSGKSYKEVYPYTKAKGSEGTGNPENSTISTADYSYHFSDRWADDELRIKAGGASGIDILDRNKVAVMPSSEVPAIAQLLLDHDMSGSRTEDTFDGITTDPAEGAFICNINGPVRAIRSFIGANSGPITQRNYYAYKSRMDIETNLRVHAMPSLMSFFDYSPEAVGMKYYREDCQSGVTVDGKSDSLSNGNLSETELVAGAQGSLLMSTVVTHNLPTDIVSLKSYYLDDASSSPKDKQHTGDAYAYGSSGIWINGDFTSMMTEYIKSQDMQAAAEKYGIQGTDPVKKSTAKTVTVSKTLKFRAPGATYADAKKATENTKTPLAYTVNDISSGPKFHVTYDKNGADFGAVPIDENGYYEGNTVTLMENTGGLFKSGYTFAGWSDSQSGTIPLSFFKMGANDATLYAVWHKNSSYTENGIKYLAGSPYVMFEERFDYADGKTAKDMVDSGKWHTRAEATSGGAFSKAYAKKLIFQGRTTESKSSSPKLGVNIDPTVITGGNTVTVTCNIRTGKSGKTYLNLYDVSEGKAVVKLVTLTGASVTTEGVGAAKIPYTQGSGAYSDQSGDTVQITAVLDFLNQKLSTYANGKVIIENASLAALSGESDLRIVLEGSYPYSAAGDNWAEFDDVVIRQAGVGLLNTSLSNGSADIKYLPDSGKASVCIDILNEKPYSYTALFVLCTYDKFGLMKNLVFTPVNVAARRFSQIKNEIDIGEKDTNMKLMLLSPTFSMMPHTDYIEFVKE